VCVSSLTPAVGRSVEAISGSFPRRVDPREIDEIRNVNASARRLSSVVVTVAAMLVAVGSHPSGAALRSHIEVLGVWSGAEEQRFRAVLRRFEHVEGVNVTYTSAGRNLPTTLETRIAQGDPPDVAMVPQPGLIKRLAEERHLVPLDAGARAAVRRNYASVWRRLGSVDGTLYGVWFKAANKSLIWYNVALFEQLGVVPPRTLDGLVSVAGTFAEHGLAAFSVGGGDGWTLTDWFENLYLTTAGPRRYDQLTQHRLAWTDPSVRAALDMFSRLLSPQLVAGGTDGALRTPFEASVAAAADRPPDAAMVFEGDFVGSLLGGDGAELSTDMDVFAFPGVRGEPPTVLGGGDAAVLLRRSAAGRALVRYLAGPRAATVWAAAGGFVSPNLNVDLTVYPDVITRNIARRVVEAGDNFRFDLSDLAPAAFGAVERQGMRGALQEFLQTRDVDATAAQLEADAAAAYGR
jgi:ABC-type glycerol-3-phosphate transport system substrate-binding protein